MIICRYRRPAALALWLIPAALSFGLTKGADAEQRALLIGVGAYENIRPLVAPAHDVAKMESFLISELGYQRHQISILTDEKATRRRILALIQGWLIEGTQAGDRVFIYFSGHGGQVEDVGGDEADGFDETLSPVDTDPAAPGSGNQITDDEIAEALQKLAGRDVTLVVDACHSGTISRSWRANTDEALPRTFFPTPARGASSVSQSQIDAHRREVSFIEALPGQTIWSAAASHQYAWESEGEGLFTKFLLEGAVNRLADRNANGVVTNAELLAFIRGRTTQWCAARPHCRLGFTPELSAPSSRLKRAFVPFGADVSEPSDILVDDELSAELPPLEIRLEILPSDSLRLGDQVGFRVTSSRPGWLVLLDIGAGGEVVQLFPNDIASQHGRDNRVRAGHPITVPDAYYGVAFTAQAPVGRGQLLAIVTEDEVALADLLALHGDFESVTTGAGYLAEIARRLQEIWRQDETNRSINWSLAVADYEITR